MGYGTSDPKAYVQAVVESWAERGAMMSEQIDERTLMTALKGNPALLAQVKAALGL